MSLAVRTLARPHARAPHAHTPAWLFAPTCGRALALAGRRPTSLGSEGTLLRGLVAGWLPAMLWSPPQRLVQQTGISEGLPALRMQQGSEQKSLAFFEDSGRLLAEKMLEKKKQAAQDKLDQKTTEALG